MKRWGGVAIVAALVAVVLPSTSAQAHGNGVVEPVARTMVTASPQITGPTGSLPWGLDRIDQRMPVSGTRSYNFANDGTGVTIYILDSGVAGNHPEFGSRVANGWSYRSSATSLNSYRAALAAYQNDPQSGIEACANDGSHASNPLVFDNPQNPDTSDVGRTDNDGHGTHVAGIAAGDGVGVAKNSTIVPVRALDSCGNGTRTMILEGLAWILADHDAGEKAVLNLSVGFGEQVTEVDNAITALMNEGVLVAAAAGNSSRSACSSTPASTFGTISIGSSTLVDGESSFSNYGSCVDMFAPGGSSAQGGAITSAYPYLSGTTNTYAALTGTSMATPFVSGSLARYLQLMEAAPTSFSTGATAAWTWLSTNATMNAITYYNSGRSPQTPNRLLYVPSAPSQVRKLVAAPSDGGAVVSWQGSVVGATYKATATPGTASCSTVGGSMCSLSGLVNGTTYTVSVVGSNADGVGPIAETKVVAGELPVAASLPSAASLNKSVKVSWSAVGADGSVYVVTSVPPSAGCITTSLFCTVGGLTNGTNYTFTVEVHSKTGLVSSPTTVSVRPGFTVRKSTVLKGSRSVLSWLLTTPSKGKKTWTESGSCALVSGRLVAPRRKTSCTLRLTVAAWRTYPKMTTTLKVTVK